MTKKPDFTLTDTVERPKPHSISYRRQRLIDGLIKQTEEMDRYIAGRWSPRMWFWPDERGKFYLEVRYAKKPLTIADGKSVIVCESIDDVGKRIEQLVALVRAGQFDTQIEATATAIRTRFKKGKQSGQTG